MQLLTTDDVQGAVCDERVHVELRLAVCHPAQLLRQDFALLDEHLVEGLKDLEVEGGGDHLAVGVPLMTCARQEPGAEPRLQEPVRVGLVDVLGAAEDDLDLFRLLQIDLRIGPNPRSKEC